MTSARERRKERGAKRADGREKREEIRHKHDCLSHFVILCARLVMAAALGPPQGLAPFLVVEPTVHDGLSLQARLLKWQKMVRTRLSLTDQEFVQNRINDWQADRAGVAFPGAAPDAAFGGRIVAVAFLKFVDTWRGPLTYMNNERRAYARYINKGETLTEDIIFLHVESVIPLRRPVQQRIAGSVA